MATPSESPYYRHGAARDGAPLRERAIEIPDSPYTTPMAVAHRGLGEWRLWRSVLEANGVTNPWDLPGMAQAGPIESATAQEDLIGVDPLSELDALPELAYRSSGAPWLLQVRVVDTAEGHAISARVLSGSLAEPTGAAGYGPATLLPPERVTGETVTLTVRVPTTWDSGVLETVELTVTSAGWLVLFLSRSLLFQLALAPSRDSLILPTE